MECSLNNIMQYLTNYNETLKKGDLESIVRSQYHNGNFDNDMAFECLSLGLNFNFETNALVREIKELHK